MFKFGVLCFFTFLNALHGNDMVGEGLWSTISFNECPVQSLTKSTLKLTVNKHRLNRSQDGVDAHAILTKEITEAYWIYIEICKFGDGGCKPFQIITDNVGSLCDKYAKKYVVDALRSSTFETDYFPLPKGEFFLNDYVIDYCAFPAVCIYARFEFKIYLLLNLKRVACVKVVAECNKCEEGQYCCDR